MKSIQKYFWIVVVLIGSIGIWWSLLLELVDKETIDWHTVTPNLITYFSAIIFTGNIDYFMSLIKKKKDNDLLSGFLDFVGFVIISIVWVAFTTFLHLKKNDVLAYIMSIIGIVASWIIWWIANKDNSNFQIERIPENAAPDGDNLQGNTGDFKLQ